MAAAAARVVAGVLFLVSGLAKLWVPGPFPGAVSRLVGPVVLALAVVFAGARLLGWLDACCGCFGGVELGERAGLVLDPALAGCAAVCAAGARPARPSGDGRGRFPAARGCT